MSKSERNQNFRLFQAGTHSHEWGKPTAGVVAHGPAKKGNRAQTRRPGLPSDILTRTSLLF
ncbi:MAG: hypothetical protein HYY25_03335 [Candidatus Wallbacteria bacterium]|nr:hypothetical protein [Candidatus Wallbacteria bacterium]MBI4866845.1 hypothetical protein [Candidatus Wallbacteria bacterium]